MTRPLRIQYPGALYHVTCRGNERKEIFKDDADRQYFLDTLAESMKIYSIRLHSFVLMTNHFHLLVETPLGNLSEFMRHFNITYTGYFNRRHNRVGHLYQGRYKSILVDKDPYLSMLTRYIHLNPVRVEKMEKLSVSEKIEYLQAYYWSSLPGYIDGRKTKNFVDYTFVLRQIDEDEGAARRAYRKQIIEDMAGGLDIWKDILVQSVLGSRDFLDWIKQSYLPAKGEREKPSLNAISRYLSKDRLLNILTEEIGKSIKEIKEEKGNLRRIAMDILYRQGGLNGTEIGGIFGVDYSLVSQERKRLREKLERDGELKRIYKKIERACQQ